MCTVQDVDKLGRIVTSLRRCKEELRELAGRYTDTDTGKELDGLAELVYEVESSADWIHADLDQKEPSC